jgi:hypothetical protein
MAHDFDTPRGVDLLDDREADLISAIRAQAAKDPRPAPDEAALADALTDTFLLAGADLGDASLAIAVIPQQRDEFRCDACFLVLHRSLRAASSTDRCRDCA